MFWHCISKKTMKREAGFISKEKKSWHTFVQIREIMKRDYIFLKRNLDLFTLSSKEILKRWDFCSKKSYATLSFSENVERDNLFGKKENSQKKNSQKENSEKEKSQEENCQQPIQTMSPTQWPYPQPVKPLWGVQYPAPMSSFLYLGTNNINLKC